LYVGHRSRDAAFADSYGQLYPLAVGSLGGYPHQFVSEYTIYGKATNAIEIEQTITPQLAMVIGSHFAGTSIEIEDNSIYLYIESERPDEALLEKMLSNGLWLAEQIDEARKSRPTPET
jgi:hypothetical protein